MRVWMDGGKCFLRDNAGETRQIDDWDAQVFIDGELSMNCFEADDQEGWALVGQGHMEHSPRGIPIWVFIPDENEPYGFKSEIRRGRVEIRLT